MRARDLLYRAAARAVRRCGPWLVRGRSKLARSVRGFGAAPGRLEHWAATHREPDTPLLWVHAPSVGEGIQAREVVLALRDLRDTPVQVAYTWTSPSVESFPLAMPADVGGYLPWDSGPDMDRALKALQPSAVVFTKTEVWPTLTRLARERGVPVALIAATLPPGAGRSGPLARWLLQDAFASLAVVGAVTAEDGKRLRALGVRQDCIRVTGDPAIDAAVAAVEADRDGPSWSTLLAGAGATLVAGSTWPEGESRLRQACQALWQAGHDLRVVLAPHEPTESRVRALLAEWGRPGREARTLTEVEAAQGIGETRTVLVDRVGVLARLYGAATFAYVGGGFGARGLHSVVEPAAHGVPILFGPAFRTSHAAASLLDAGGALACDGAAALEDRMRRWLTDEGARRMAGQAARHAMNHHRGAARRSATLVQGLLEGRGVAGYVPPSFDPLAQDEET